MHSEIKNPNAIAIIGMSIRVPGADCLGTFWDNLVNERECISTFSNRELVEAGVDPQLLELDCYVKAKGIINNIELFDSSLFRFTSREAEVMDPQQRVLLECAYEALAHAGYVGIKYKGNIGVFAGVGNTEYYHKYILPNKKIIGDLGELQLEIGNGKDYVATQISYRLGLHGPSISLHTACSTSLVCVHVASQSLLQGDCDMALAGSISLTVPQKSGYVYKEGGILSSDGRCRAFDISANGTVRGEGGGVVVLKKLNDAVRDNDTIYAVIHGSAINNDGLNKIGFTAPSIDGQSSVIKAALSKAKIHPNDISYIEAHGTGTRMGDVIEIEGIKQAFKDGKSPIPCGIGSVKTNIGHLDAGAGIASLIKVVLSLKHKVIPATLHFTKLNPNIDFGDRNFYINSATSPWLSHDQVRFAGISCFGLGGTNAHLVISEALERTDVLNGDNSSYHAILLSARTRASLSVLSHNIAEHLGRNVTAGLANVEFTLKNGRENFNFRKVGIFKSITEAYKMICSEIGVENVYTNVEGVKRQSTLFIISDTNLIDNDAHHYLYKIEKFIKGILIVVADILIQNIT